MTVLFQIMVTLLLIGLTAQGTLWLVRRSAARVHQRAARPRLPIRGRTRRQVLVSRQALDAVSSRMEQMRSLGARQEAALFVALDELATAQATIAELTTQLAQAQQQVHVLQQKHLPFLPIDVISQATTFLIVGSRGSGKTTLLRALLERVTRTRYVIDPHASLGKWPTGTMVIGGGRAFDAIRAHIVWMHGVLDQRSKELEGTSEAAAQFPPMMVASDEWRAIIKNTTVERGERSIASLALDILTEGRKFALGFGAVAHNDTAESVLGLRGEHETFLTSFDWIIYTGAFVADKLRTRYPEAFAAIPWVSVETDAGVIDMPLHVVAYQPTTRQIALIDLRTLAPRPVLSNTSMRPPLGESVALPPAAVTDDTLSPLETAERAGPELLITEGERTAVLEAAHRELETARSTGRKPSISAVSRQALRHASGRYRQKTIAVLHEAALYERFTRVETVDS